MNYFTNGAPYAFASASVFGFRALFVGMVIYSASSQVTEKHPSTPAPPPQGKVLENMTPHRTDTRIRSLCVSGAQTHARTSTHTRTHALTHTH